LEQVRNTRVYGAAFKRSIWIVDIGKMQKKQTYNMFNLINGTDLNFVPPPLHIKLGLINKILDVLDEVSAVWIRKHYWVNLGPYKSPIENQLRYNS